MSPYFLVDKYFYVKHGSFSFALREKCPNTEYFLVRIFLYSDWIRNSSCHTIRYARCVATWWSLKVGGNREWLLERRYKLIRCVAELFSRIFYHLTRFNFQEHHIFDCISLRKYFSKAGNEGPKYYEYGHFYAVSFIPFILSLPWWVSL